MKGGKCRVSSPSPGGSIFSTSAPRSPRLWVQNGPASTRVRSMTRIPASGPAQVFSLSDVLKILLPKEPCARACSGHPRLKSAARHKEDVGGRDKPGHGE